MKKRPQKSVRPPGKAKRRKTKVADPAVVDDKAAAEDRVVVEDRVAVGPVRGPTGDVPELRIRALNDAPAVPDGAYVLYWMIATRRTQWNFALQRAVDWARALGRPLVVFEPLRIGYEWASDRLHRFVIDGMRANARALKSSGVFYYPYIEPAPDADKGLLAALAKRACVVVTDDFPCFFLPRMLRAAARLPVRLEAVDSNGLVPLRATDQVFPTAYAFRRFVQRELPQHMLDMPRPNPLARVKLPPAPKFDPKILRHWPPADERLLSGDARALARLPIDHEVLPAPARGGSDAARRMLRVFLDRKLDNYVDDRNEPELEGSSGLSPYLHFGHLSTHEVFHELMHRERWSPERLSEPASGKRAGWWNVSPAAEAFLDQFITWRELGYNFCSHREDYDRYESLPAWALATLAKHARDKRPLSYSARQFDAAATHDRLWNAAQNQLRREGRIHNYLRMLWGKKILQWSETPEEALEHMIHLNNKYALDGRDPNSYSGIFWTLGRYDRPWGPERPIFGTVRYMSSENTARKFSVAGFLERYAPN